LRSALVISRRAAAGGVACRTARDRREFAVARVTYKGKVKGKTDERAGLKG